MVIIWFLRRLERTENQVEKLLAEVGAAEAEARSPRAGPSAGLDARSRMFERLASEISRLSFHVARGKVAPPVARLHILSTAS